MKHEPVPSGKLRAVQLSIAEERIADAEALGIDLEGTLERALAAEIKREREQRWLDENRDALDEWNQWIEENGSPLDRFRAF